jgi:hypothetical protein
MRRQPNDEEVALVGRRYNDERSGKLYEVAAVRWSWKYTSRTGFPGMIVVAYRQPVGTGRSRGDLEGFGLEYTRARLAAQEKRSAAAVAALAAETTATSAHGAAEKVANWVHIFCMYIATCPRPLV